jgi:predicted transcriptional regulator
MAKVTSTFRIDEDLKNRLGEAAKAQHRTSSNLIEWLIGQYLEQIARRTAPSKPKGIDGAMNGAAFAAAVEGTLGEWGSLADDEAWNGL